ncbi:hypothetical protein JCGZ_16326 [Jatropha curcas]|uniref:Uncharacterized protein n=1 Tax=Jatropha curcas TaxID=180498 RepID=A0A067LB73_JATCU|nr:uncharacterized protein LOC105650777 [Jatropha curcas]KDP44493.1 hypothetical protein JCGZ_16326 [Jatropha curcas]
MANFIHALSALLFLILVSQGNGQQCDNNSNFVITQSATGVKVGNKPEWKVTVKNNCVCTRTSIAIGCNGFQTTEKLNPSIIALEGGKCVVKVNSGVLHGFESFSFTYAWDSQFNFNSVESLVQCS